MSNVRIECGPCVQCGESFLGFKGNPNKYCSRLCMGAERRNVPQPHFKVCTCCLRTLPVDDFGTHARPNRTPGKRYVNALCRACALAGYDKAKARDRSLRRRYGISSADFDAMLSKQGGCAICGRTESNGKYWHVDHDHECCATQARSCGKCIRAILCHGCNTALGNVKDDIVILRKMIAYLEAHNG